MDLFAENARPTSEGIVGSLAILRKPVKPFAEEELATRLDLLLLPFLSGIQTEEERVSRLGLALKLAADRLPPAYEVVYRHVFLDPTEEEIGERRTKAVAELGERFPSRRGNETPSVKSIEGRLLPLLAEILLDPEFEHDLDNEYPKPVSVDTDLFTHAFQLLSVSLSFEIDRDDYRKSVYRKVTRLEALVPDQRVATIRYHTRASNPMPVKGSVVMLSEGHTYLGTLPDSQEGDIADWMDQFIHLGGRKEPGDKVEIDMRQEFFDEAKSDTRPCVTFTLDQECAGCVNLALRLPLDMKPGTKAESRIVRSPHSKSVTLKRKSLTIEEDGWVRAEFTELQSGLQYGIFLPNFNLYK